MFTGIIQLVSSVKSVSPSAGGIVLSVDLQKFANEIKIGDSISINGACLTVTKLANGLASFDVSGETIEKTTLGKITAGSKVNIELAMKADDRFGGHFVLGHVDGTAIIKKIDKQGEFVNMTFTAPKDLISQMIPKGSVAIDGISLTVAAMDNESFTVALIPQTLKETNLAFAKVGQKVNIETDIITKSVKKHLESMGIAKDRMTIDKLKDLGF